MIPTMKKHSVFTAGLLTTHGFYGLIASTASPIAQLTMAFNIIAPLVCIHYLKANKIEAPSTESLNTINKNTESVLIDFVSFRFVKSIINAYNKKKVDMDIPDYVYAFSPLALLSVLAFATSFIDGMFFSVSAVFVYQYLKTTTEKTSVKLSQKDVANDFERIKNTVKNTSTFKYLRSFVHDLFAEPTKTTSQGSPNDSAAPSGRLSSRPHRASARPTHSNDSSARLSQAMGRTS